MAGRDGKIPSTIFTAYMVRSYTVSGYNTQDVHTFEKSLLLLFNVIWMSQDPVLHSLGACLALALTLYPDLTFLVRLDRESDRQSGEQESRESSPNAGSDSRRVKTDARTPLHMKRRN